MNDIIKDALVYADRREYLSKEMNKQKLTCDKCGTNQVQLTGYIEQNAEWKCRHCKYIFIWEPLTA